MLAWLTSPHLGFSCPGRFHPFAQKVNSVQCPPCLFSFKIPLSYFFNTLFLERGREGERERNIIVWLPLTCLLLGTWPATQARALDWELNQRPFGSQTGTQPIKPHQPGLIFFFF